jgi:adenylosuccinate synthase
VLDQLGEIQICVGYRLDGKMLTHFPACTTVLDRVEPVYETLPGWVESVTSVRKFRKLPRQAQRYIKRIEQLAGKPVEIVSVGPNRDSTILL